MITKGRLRESPAFLFFFRLNNEPACFYLFLILRFTGRALFLPLLIYIPYVDVGRDLISSLASFRSTMHYNDSLFALFRLFFGNLAYLIGSLLLFICLAWIFLFVHGRLQSAYLALCSLLIFLPTLHPWYLVLIAPFMVFYPSKAWLYLQAAMVFTFQVSIHLDFYLI